MKRTKGYRGRNVSSKLVEYWGLGFARSFSIVFGGKLEGICLSHYLHPFPLIITTVCLVFGEPLTPVLRLGKDVPLKVIVLRKVRIYDVFVCT